MPVLKLAGVGPLHQLVLSAREASATEQVLDNFWATFGNDIQNGMPLKPEWFKESPVDAELIDDPEQGRAIVIWVDKNHRDAVVVFVDGIDQQHSNYAVWVSKGLTEYIVEEAIQALYIAVFTPYYEAQAA